VCGNGFHILYYRLTSSDVRKYYNERKCEHMSKALQDMT
jgi:hypothetical protein